MAQNYDYLFKSMFPFFIFDTNDICSCCNRSFGCRKGIRWLFIMIHPFQTNLVKQFTKNEFEVNKKPTVIEFYEKLVNSNNAVVKSQIWDIGEIHF